MQSRKGRDPLKDSGVMRRRHILTKGSGLVQHHCGGVGKQKMRWIGVWCWRGVVSIWSEQWKIWYHMVQDDHVSGLLKSNWGKGCWNTRDQANLEADMLVSHPLGCWSHLELIRCLGRTMSPGTVHLKPNRPPWFTVHLYPDLIDLSFYSRAFCYFELSKHFHLVSSLFLNL